MSMQIIEIASQENGMHYNHTYHGVLPEGWAFLPDELECENFPFGNVTVEEKDGVPVVIAWEPLPMPEPEPVAAIGLTHEPTLEERISALENSNAKMAETLNLLLSGAKEA